MSGKLDGRRVVVTGGARGIGSDIVRSFLHEGARIVFMDIRELERHALLESLNAGDRCFFVKGDVSLASDVTAAFAFSDKCLGGLDALAAVAGRDRPSSPESLSEEDWDRVIDINAKGTYLTNQAAYHRLKTQGGAIINFGSIAGIRGYPERPAYSAEKAAIG